MQGVYECRQRLSPAFHCLQLLRRGRNPDVLAATLRVDLGEVYRVRAEELFEQAQFAQSFHYFTRASTNQLQLIAKFAAAGQLSLVAQSLRQQLSSQASFSSRLRKCLAGLMLLTYIYLDTTLPTPLPAAGALPSTRQARCWAPKGGGGEPEKKTKNKGGVHVC